ncbi:MAG: DUF5010 domain-containing protein [Melioribacteraceae bacterium]
MKNGLSKWQTSSALIVFLTLCAFQNLIYAQNQKKPVLMAHYMPWYQSKDYSGTWGWHWTMNHFDPNKVNSNGQREIASKYYPLTGPYDSQDPDILEYQVLLMKLSGIDGVMVDWYGDENYNDYEIINKNTGSLFNWIKRAKLQFAIVYEDQTIKHMVSGGKISSADAKTYASKAINYINANWASTSTYLKKDGQPVLLTFGPQYFKNSSDWETIFSGINPRPLFITLDNVLNPVASGAYPWPPMDKSVNGVLSQASLASYLSQFYQKAANWNYKVGSAFPAFNDIYKEAGVGTSYGFLDPQNGFTFSTTLDRAINNNCDVIQLVTWNDYGEGTIIEPTVEFGYSYLEKVQEVKKRSIDTNFVFAKADLELPIRIFKLRKNSDWALLISKSLDDAFQLIIDNDFQKAKKIIDSLSVLTKIESESLTESCELFANYPNPFNPTTQINYSIAKAGFVSLKIYDVLGREITSLVNEFQRKGSHSVRFDASSLASGVYVYTINAGEFVHSKKMMLIK